MGRSQIMLPSKGEGVENFVSSNKNLIFFTKASQTQNKEKEVINNSAPEFAPKYTPNSIFCHYLLGISYSKNILKIHQFYTDPNKTLYSVQFPKSISQNNQ